MKLRTILAVSALGAAVVPAAALAQTPDPVGGNTIIGGGVQSFLELSIAQPSTAFTTFTKAKTYSSKFDVAVTITDGGAQLSLADGEAVRGSKLGHLTSGSKRLPLALEARVGKSAFQPLDAAVAPLLTKWSDVGTKMKSTVNLRQQVKSKASGKFRKVVLVTLSTETP